jgi:ubiquinone/menaquinone biosynthesis C-methylase UbiE
MTTRYLLGESQGETERLRHQVEIDPIEARVLEHGLAPGMRVVDAGCGPGELTRTLARLTGPRGRVTGFDPSEARLAAARSVVPAAGAAPIEFLAGDLYAPPVPPGSADFVFCQYVFEYLKEPVRAARSLSALLAPGGRLLVVDVDGVGLTAWPVAPALEAAKDRVLASLAEDGFDPYCGRKLFNYLWQAGLTDVRAAMYPLLARGGSEPEDGVPAWEQRFEAIRVPGERALGREGYAALVQGYLAMLRDHTVLKYRLVVGVSGTRP